MTFKTILKATGGLVAGAASIAGLARAREEVSTPVVSVLQFHGLMDKANQLNGYQGPYISLENRKKEIDLAFEPRRLECVVLSIDSWGGCFVPGHQVAAYLRVQAARRGVPVVAFIEDLATGYGYNLACAADLIYCDPYSRVGNLGHDSMKTNHKVRGTEQAGDGKSGDSKGKGAVDDTKNVVTAGKNKIVPDASLEQNNAEECNRVLIQQIKESRGPRLKGEDEVLFSGGEWTGRMAEELGLVDGCGTMDGWLEERYRGKVRLLFVPSVEGGSSRGPGDQQLVVLQQQLQAMQQQQQLQKSQQQLQHGQLRVTEQQLHVMQQHLQMSHQQQQQEEEQELQEEEEVVQELKEQPTKPEGDSSAV